MAQLNPDGTPMSVMQIVAQRAAAANANPALAAPVPAGNVPMGVPTAPAAAPGPAFATAPVTVAGGVDALIAKDSPLMQRAAARGTQIAAQRGVTNSSLAAGTSMSAVLDAATPIATADANLANQRDQLAQQKEQFAQTLGMTSRELDLRRDTLTAQQKQAADDIDLRSKALGESTRQFDATTKQAQENFTSTQAHQKTMAELDQGNRVALANIEAQWKGQMQGNMNLTNAWGTMMQGIQQIQNNPELSSDAKRQLIGNTTAAFESYALFFNKATSIDVGPLLDFGVTSAPGKGDDTSSYVPPSGGGGGGYGSGFDVIGGGGS
jgi:hypothetical protein